jgi:hypothetical protein
MDMEKLGRYTFVLGLVISVIAGFVNIPVWGLIGLLLLGVVVGLLNITGKEVQPFLLGTIALMLVGASTLSLMASIPGGEIIASIIRHFTAFVAGGALIVALKEVYSLTSTK